MALPNQVFLDMHVESENGEFSLRDYFAAAAISGCVGITGKGIPTNNRDVYLKSLAENAFAVADALIAARHRDRNY